MKCPVCGEEWISLEMKNDRLIEELARLKNNNVKKLKEKYPELEELVKEAFFR